jgi:DNA-binding beta-propeller fold protein YncE
MTSASTFTTIPPDGTTMQRTPTGGPVAPELGAVRVEGAWASLEWKPSPSQGVAGYRVYRATWPQYEYIPVSGLLTDTQFREFGGDLEDSHHRVYAITAVGGDGLESGFSELAYAPGLGDPVAVALAPDGARTVLNDWNTYPLLRQRPDGRYTHRLVNVHYDLGTARHLAYDEAGRLLISGFGEFPDGRHAVRVYDQDLQPLWAFSEEGSAPGQFTAPSGIAPLGPACVFGGPFERDGHTLLLLHFDGDYSGTQGEIGTATGTEFTDGRFGQGVLLDETDTLTYTVAGNLNHTQGAVESWMRPDWDGADGRGYTPFWRGEEENSFTLRKDDVPNLVFDYFYEGGGCGAATGGAHWRAGEWHHVAFTWKETEIRLYVDGRQVALAECGGTAQPTAPEFYVGSWLGGIHSINAVIDELRISDIPRVGNSEACNHILVADSSNQRIQAFDSLGNLLATYGSLGSGADQFDSPQGLMVNESGRVLVADQGNNCLVLLGFDGTGFSYLDSISAGFNAPTGVAVDAWGNIAVADTGDNRVVVLDAEGGFLAEYTEPNDGYTGPFNAPRGVAVGPCGTLIVADTGNRRVVTARSALPGCKTWLPLVVRRWGTE